MGETHWGELMENTKKSWSFVLTILQPGAIAILTIMFFSGMGLAHYLGSTLDWGRSILACVAFYFLIWSRNLLGAYFNHPASPTSVLMSPHPHYAQLAAQKRSNLLIYSMYAMTGGAALTVFVMVRNPYALPFLILMGVAFLACFFAVVPPLRFQHRGYGEVIEAIVVASIVPAAGLVLNYGEVHGVLAMLTLPVVALYLACLLVFSLPDYWVDKKGGKPNLLNKLDWARSMKLHNILVGSAFLSVAVFSVSGLSWSLAWPMLLPLPLGIFQIVQMLGIMNGAPPRWQILKWTAGASLGLFAYLVLLTLWLH
jgi:1,4-dihydroxy-2-naphthoate octaprenyltransferase